MARSWRSRRAGAIASRVKSGLVQARSLGGLQKSTEPSKKGAGPKFDWQRRCEEAIRVHAEQGTFEAHGIDHGKLMDLIDPAGKLGTASQRIAAIHLITEKKVTASSLLGFLKENGFCKPGLDRGEYLTRNYLRSLVNVGLLLKLPQGRFKEEPTIQLNGTTLRSLQLEKH